MGTDGRILVDHTISYVLCDYSLTKQIIFLIDHKSSFVPRDYSLTKLIKCMAHM